MKSSEPDKDDKKPKLYHAAFASCTCGWSLSVPAEDKTDLHMNAVPTAQHRARLHLCRHTAVDRKLNVA